MTNEHNFELLVPKVKTPPDSNMQIYFDALDFVYQSDKARNIAITGIYGAGKSSVWQSYVEYCQIHDTSHMDNVIQVSLAKFKSENDDQYGEEIRGSYSSNEKRRSRVEDQILNQILYQVPVERIPLSKHKPKQNVSARSVVKFIVNLILATLGSISLVELSTIKNLIANAGLLRLLAYFIPILLFLYPMINLTSWLLCKRIFNVSKLIIKGSEINTHDNKPLSIFDHELKELIYIIRESNAGTIVFEDLDRYGDVELFSRLRELNYLINSSSSRTIRFIYVLRDDLFNTSDRTKFFDFIIPIVPILDSYNSTAFMTKKYEETMKTNFSKESSEYISDANDHLIKIAYFINDMRVLNNIFNEFKIYIKSIDSVNRKLSPTKLFSMLVVKNILPAEFELLQQDEGYLFEVFHNKQDLVDKQIKAFDLSDRDETERILQLKATDRRNKSQILALNVRAGLRIGEESNHTTLAEIFTIWAKQPETTKFVSNLRYTNIQLSYQELEKDVRFIHVEKYNEDLELYEAENIERAILISKEHIDSNHHKRSILSNRSLLDLIKESTPEDLQTFFKSHEKSHIDARGYSLLSYLLAEGLIDESYSHYRSHFHPGSLTPTDDIFYRTLMESRALSPTYELDNAKDILKRLSPHDYYKPGTINYSIISALIECESNLELSNLFSQIINGNHVDKIITYLDSITFEKLFELLTMLIAERKINPFDLLNQPAYSKELNERLLIAIVANSSQIKYFSTHIIKQIEEDASILTNESLYGFDIFFKEADRLKLSFENLSGIDLQKYIFQQIEERGLFDLNLGNVLHIASYSLNETTDIFARLLTILENSPELKSTRKRVFDTLPTFLEKMLQNAKPHNVQLSNDESIVLKILNTDMDNIMKADYAALELTLVSSIEKVDDSRLWPLLFKLAKVERSNENTNAYWQNLSDIESMIPYLNAFSLSNFKSMELPIDLADQLINMESINNELFKKSVENAASPILVLNENLADDRYKILAKADLINLSANNLAILLGTDLSEIYLVYVKQYRDEILDLFDGHEELQEMLTKEHVESILNAQLFDDGEAISLLEIFDNDVSTYQIPNANLPVREYVLRNHFDEGDFDKLVLEANSSDIWTVFLEILQKPSLLAQLRNAQMNQRFIDDVLSETNVPDSFKTRLLTVVLDKSFMPEKWGDWIEIVDSIANIARVFKNGRPVIENEDQLILSNQLVEVGLISYNEESKRLYLKPTMLSELVEK